MISWNHSNVWLFCNWWVILYKFLFLKLQQAPDRSIIVKVDLKKLKLIDIISI